MFHAFSKTEWIIGRENLQKLKKSKVAIFGIGGVGSHVAEGLARCAIGSFVLVDEDEIEITNINRQIHATSKTVGRSKVDVMKQRILDINPDAEVETFQDLYQAKNAEKMLSLDYSYLVDTIDMVSSKIDLIQRCYEMSIPIISSMGAGNKLNPTMLEVEDLYKTSICPLARVMRSELRKRNVKKLKVVYSKEKPEVFPEIKRDDNYKHCIGSISFVPSVAGFIIASEVIKDIIAMD